MKKISTHAAAAKACKKELIALVGKDRVLGVKSDSYSGGSSIDATITNPTPAERKAAEALVRKYQYGSFNSMEDIYEYSSRNSDLPQVKFAFLHVEYSEELKAKAVAFVEEAFGAFDCQSDKRDAVYRVLTGCRESKFWPQQTA